MCALKKSQKTGILVAVAVVGVAVAATVVLSTVFRSSDDVSQAQVVVEDGKELVEVRTFTRVNCEVTPFVVAEQLGYFEEEGIKLVETGTLDFDKRLPSIINGENDLGSGHPNEVALYVAGGAPIKGVSRGDLDPLDDSLAEHRHMQYWVRDDSGITSWEGIANGEGPEKIRINGTVPSCATFNPSKIFERYGIPAERLEFVTFTSDREALQAVAQGDLDIAQIHPPFFRQAKETPNLLFIGDTADSGVGAAAGTYLWYFSEEFINAHPDRVQAFVNAITRAQIWIDNPANFDQAAEWTGERIGADASTTHYYAADTAIVEEDIQLWIDDLVSSGHLEENELKAADIITHQFYNPDIHG
jgi:ABC-type nitrate/sulfonate/bicarbonate transport system substrate-binding protein